MLERPSRVPGAIVWTSRPTGDEYRVLPDGCMDIIWATDGSLVVAGPDTAAFITSGVAGSTMTGIRLPPASRRSCCACPPTSYETVASHSTR